MIAAAAFLGISIAGTGGSARALVIAPTFDLSITDNYNAAAIERAITGALGFYSAFGNSETVSVDYQLAPSGASYLGASESSFYVANYATYTGEMLSNATAYGNTVERTAYSNLGSGNLAQQITSTSADFRALGLTAPGRLAATGGTQFDGIIFLNASELTGFGAGGNYGASRVIQHETDEVLGIGGAGSVLNTMAQNGMASPPTFNGKTYIGPLDMFRYSAPGFASLTTSSSASSYFSVDGGATNLVAFNQNSTGDYADWGAPGCTALVQQAFSCAGQTATLGGGSPEVAALQVIGYDQPVPEPASLSLFGAGVIALGVSRRRLRPHRGL